MAIEIERKFLVADRSCVDGLTGERYRQAYLCTDPDRTVRVREAPGRAYLTVKGRGDGIARPEFEYAIPPADTDALFALCVTAPLEKLRYRVLHRSMCWELDVFLADNLGLIVAEIELERADQTFARPPWLGREVSADSRYSNAYLAQHPYRFWPPSNA